MYPVPAKAETQGRSEIALGKWLKTVPRHNVVVASKVRERDRQDRQARRADGHSHATACFSCYAGVASISWRRSVVVHGDCLACGVWGFWALDVA